MSQDALSRDAGPEISRADQLYQERGWAAALPLYETAARTDPVRAGLLSVPLMIAHCRIELAADPAAAAADAHAALPTGTPREHHTTKIVRARALELCRAGDTTRASALLRMLCGYDGAIADTYRHAVAPGASSPEAGEPPFLAALGIAELQLDAIKHAARGKHVLLVYRRFFPESGPRRGEVINCLTVSAERFGLTVKPFRFEGADPAEIAPALLRELLDFKPDLVVYDNQYPFSMSGEPELLREQLESLLALARRQLGIRVVVSYMDAWQQMQIGPAALFRGLGEAFDLLQHCHPAARGAGTPAQNERTFCYMIPAWVPAPSVVPDTVPRACFAGSIAWFNIARLVWWAETARRGLPVDFLETLHYEGEPRSDQDYVDLFARYQVTLNFTRRAGGPTIMTGRSLDVPLVGGVLLEEASTDTAYFLKPGVHFVPFGTLDELAALIPALLADPARRARLREDGRRWVETYFTGDYFWAGLLRQLADLPRA